MAPFEYLLIFAAVILGLAVCELAIALNRLLAAWARIEWDWLAPLAALLCFLKIVVQWWTWQGAGPLAAGISFEMYIAVLASAALLFMLAAAALPGSGPDGGTDLRAHYESVRRRYWTLFTLHFLTAAGISIWLQMRVEHASLSLASPVYLIAPVGISLIFVRNRWWHTIALIGLCLVYFLAYFGTSLT
jgi:hypothetical protein